MPLLTATFQVPVPWTVGFVRPVGQIVHQGGHGAKALPCLIVRMSVD